MVAGDIISEIGALGATISFQPALTVEVIVLSHFPSDTYDTLALTDGVLTAYQYNKGGDTQDVNQSNEKVMINNTNYLTVAGGTLPVTKSFGFSGLQIK